MKMLASMYESEAQARETAAPFPNVWQAIAVLDLPDDGRFRMEQNQTGCIKRMWRRETRSPSAPSVPAPHNRVFAYH